MGIFCIQSFPLHVRLRLTSIHSMIFSISIFFWCRPTTFLLLQVFFLGLLSMSSIHIHTEGWTIYICSWSPLFSLLTVTVVRMFCSFSSESAINICHLRILDCLCCYLQLWHLYRALSFPRIIWLWMLKRSGEKNAANFIPHLIFQIICLFNLKSQNEPCSILRIMHG